MPSDFGDEKLNLRSGEPTKTERPRLISRIKIEETNIHRMINSKYKEKKEKKNWPSVPNWTFLPLFGFAEVASFPFDETRVSQPRRLVKYNKIFIEERERMNACMHACGICLKWYQLCSDWHIEKFQWSQKRKKGNVISEQEAWVVVANWKK